MPASSGPATVPESRADEVYRRLRGLIVRGRVAPGTRIIESEVAQRLGASRTPVRSALQRLLQEGYIVDSARTRQMRLWVAPLTETDARELFAIVGEVEALAARLAAGLPGQVRSGVTRELRAIDDALLEEAGRPRPDPGRLFDLFTRFHRTYVDRAAGPRLIRLHDAIKPQAERYRRLYNTVLIARIPDSVEEHRAIIMALEEGDPDGAQRAVQVNWRNAADRLARAIDEVGERGAW